MSIRHWLLSLGLVALALAIGARSMPVHADPFLVEESVIATCCLVTASPSIDQAGGRLSGDDFSFQGGGLFIPTGGPTGRFFASGDPINLSGSVSVTPDLTVTLHGTNWITAGGQLNFHVPSTHDVQLFGNQFRIFPAQSFSMDGLIAADSLSSPQRLNLSVAGIGTAIAFGRIISDPGDPNQGKLEVTNIQYAFSQVIPEPSTWLLLATGLVALLFSKKQFVP